MEKAVIAQRDKVLKDTDERLALIDRQRRDSILKNRGFSMKLNIKNDNSGRKESQDDDLLLDGDDDLLQETN